MPTKGHGHGLSKKSKGSRAVGGKVTLEREILREKTDFYIFPKRVVNNGNNNNQSMAASHTTLLMMGLGEEGEPLALKVATSDGADLSSQVKRTCLRGSSVFRDQGTWGNSVCNT